MLFAFYLHVIYFYIILFAYLSHLILPITLSNNYIFLPLHMTYDNIKAQKV